MSGRWPANVILSPDMAEVLDQQSGISKSNVRPPTGKDERGVPNTASGMTVRRNDTTERGHADEGGASRFFLNAGYEQWELEWIYKVGLKPCGMEEL